MASHSSLVESMSTWLQVDQKAFVHFHWNVWNHSKLYSAVRPLFANRHDKIRASNKTNKQKNHQVLLLMWRFGMFFQPRQPHPNNLCPPLTTKFLSLANKQMVTVCNTGPIIIQKNKLINSQDSFFCCFFPCTKHVCSVQNYVKTTSKSCAHTKHMKKLHNIWWSILLQCESVCSLSDLAPARGLARVIIYLNPGSSAI